MIGLKPLLNDSKVSSPSMPGRPVRVCQLQWFPSCLRHHLSPWGSICESWRVASVLPACDFHSLAHSAAVLQWASIRPATGRYCPFSLSFHTAHCYQLPIWRTYYQPTKNHSGALEKERSGMGWAFPFPSSMWHSENSPSFTNLWCRDTKFWDLLIKPVLFFFLFYNAHITRYFEKHKLLPVIEHTCFSFFQREQNKTPFQLQKHRQDTGAGPRGCSEPPGNRPVE